MEIPIPFGQGAWGRWFGPAPAGPHGPQHGPHHGPHGPHPHPHGPRPRPHGRPGEAGGLTGYVQELAAMGAGHEDLHAVIDGYLEALRRRAAGGRGVPADPGRGLDPWSRAGQIAAVGGAARQAWLASLRGRSALVAGEFPPHLLEELLASGAVVTQVHPRTPEGHLPPHFHHLAPWGLRGVTELAELAGVQAEVVLLHGAPTEGQVAVSPVAPVVLRMFPGATVLLEEAEHLPPHAAFRIPDPGFARVPRWI